MPLQTEPDANNALGSLLEAMLPKSDVRSENTRPITGHPSLRPDILITASDRAPVAIEAEHVPAMPEEPEATERLGLEVAVSRRVIEAANVLRYPEDISEARDLHAALSENRLTYCVFTGNGGRISRFSESGWLCGTVEDLVYLVSVPQRPVA